MRWLRGRKPNVGPYENRSFWNARYRSDPELGSGIGSRGELADRKRALVEQIWKAAGEPSILDIGFGDLNVLDLARFPRYTGVDVSDIAVQNAQTRYPGHRFVRADVAGDGEPDLEQAGMVLCLDVLIHQLDGDAYRRMVGRIVRHSTSVGLVSGYDSRPSADFASDITAYHEDLSQTLRDAGAHNLVKVAEYRGLTMILFHADPDAPPIEFSAETT